MTQRNPDLNEPKDPSVAEIEAGIDQTRSVISSDIQELSAKLDPDRLKSQAKTAYSDAKEHLKDEARGMMSDAKHAAKTKIRDAKQAAVDRVSDRYHDVEDRMRDAGGATWSFARENAIPLGLIGLGAAWLVAQNRSGTRRLRASEEYELEAEVYPSAYEYDGPFEPEELDTRSEGSDGGGLANGVRQRTERIGEGMSKGARKMKSAASRAGHRAQDLGHRAEGKMRERAHRARDRADHELHRVRDIANDNPLALGAVALAMGLGVGMLLPSTRKENELLGARRDRLLGDAKTKVDELGTAAKQIGGAAKQIGNVAKDTAHDVKQTFSSPSSSSQPH